MPIAMAPRSEPVKTTRVMGSGSLHVRGSWYKPRFAAVAFGEFALERLEFLLLLRFLDHDEIGLRQPAGYGSGQLAQEDKAGRDREYEADAVEQPRRQPGRGSRHVPVDQGLFPAADEQQPGHVEHE